MQRPGEEGVAAGDLASRPRYSTITRSLMCRTTLILCEMKISAIPISRRSRISRLTICAWIETSSAETGSSQTISFGRRMMARAMPMRWHWPPENSCG